MNWKRIARKIGEAGIVGILGIAGIGVLSEVTFDGIWMSQHEGSKVMAELSPKMYLIGVQTQDFNDLPWLRNRCLEKGGFVNMGVLIPDNSKSIQNIEDMPEWHGSCLAFDRSRIK